MKNKESVFSRLFSYRQRENVSPLENYLTELFSFCLEFDLGFREKFFEECLKIKLESNDFKIETQVHYNNMGRPDIEISCGDIFVIIECKVNSVERENQLDDYRQILNNHHTEKKYKHLVFLTKFYENREIDDFNINFHLIRWFNVSEIIENSNSEITNELKKFLKDQGMERVKNFTLQDILAMKSIAASMTKMDQLLDFFKDQFYNEFKGYSKNSSRSTSLNNNRYTNYVTLKFNKIEYYLHLGFFWWWEEDELPYVGISIILPLKKFKNSKLLNDLRNELVVKHEWELEEDNYAYYISSFSPITDFISTEDGVSEMQTFIQDQLNVLYDLKNKVSGLLTK